MNIYTSLYFFKDMSWVMAVLYVILVIGLWKIFEKAGIEGWKAVIPFYNFYLLFQIAGMGTLFWILLVCRIIAAVVYFFSRVIFIFYPIGWIFTIGAFVIELLMWTNLAKAFGKGMGYALGLWLLNPIFILLLGFGTARYRGNPLQY